MTVRNRALALGTLAGLAAIAVGAGMRDGLLAAFGVALFVSCGVALWIHRRDHHHEDSPDASVASAAQDARPIGTTGPPEDSSAGPASLASPAEVCRALLAACAGAGEPLASHLWLQDAPQGALRLVASSGPVRPTQAPVEATDPVLGEALEVSHAVLRRVSAVVADGVESSLWRYAMPVLAGTHTGVAAVDILSAGEPDHSILDHAFTSVTGQLAGTLALDAARIESETATTLLDMARELSRIVSAEEVLEACLDKAMTLSDAATGSVMLADEASGAMRIATARGLPADVTEQTTVAAGEGIAGWVMMSGHSALVEDLPSRRAAARHGVRSAVSVPIIDEHGTLGVLNVGSRDHPARFSASHVSALEVLGRQTAVALRNARAIATARELHFSTLRALALAMETKDPYGCGATDRIVGYTTGISELMRLSPTDAEAVRLAALLHDICMDETTGSASRRSHLSTVERGMLSMHPVLAAEMLGQAPALAAVVPIVYHHHEWYDGRGYVGGLSGDQIPLGARILAVADAYVAMTSERPYRASMSPREALAELQAKSGTQFDPGVVDAMRQLVRDDGERVRPEGD